MNQAFDYKKYFKIAIEQIQQLRTPQATSLTHQSLGWRVIQNQSITDIGGGEFDRFSSIIPDARKITFNCVLNILWNLLQQRAKHCNLLPPNSELLKDTAIPLAFTDTESNDLVIVTEKEPDLVCVADNYVPDKIATLMEAVGATRLRHVYMLHDYAYLQYIKHTEDEDDPSRGCGAYSLSWLFDTYFGIEEYPVFKRELSNYKKEIDEHLGYALVRVLNSSALEKFRMITEKELLTFNYSQVEKLPVVSKKKPTQPCILQPGEFEKIRTQFIDNYKYKVLLGKSDFAESLITAEWLRDSMSKAQAIDLTVIGTGYFKAAEQLLYSLVKLRLSYIDEKDTFGNFAYRYQKNQRIFFHNHLDDTTKEYVYETIYRYAELRNGYFHKHNIHDPKKIEEIRTATFLLAFLILGSQKLSGTDLGTLGASNLQKYNEFDKLCDYIEFHAHDFFCFQPEGFPDQWTQIVPKSSIPASIKNAEISRSFYPLILATKTMMRITESNVPARIWIGKLDIKQTEEISLDLLKDKLLFENGRFVGPKLAEEKDFTY